MTKQEYYQHELGQSDDWMSYLLCHSNLPGPGANLELMEAFVEMGFEKDFIPLLDHTQDIAPVNSPEEFLAFCGTAGLGELLANGLNEYLPDLRRQASDPRRRIREAVARALQIVGMHDYSLLASLCEDWITGNLMEQRAVAAGICEPLLLSSSGNAELALGYLDRITKQIIGIENRKTKVFAILCKGLSYCWSVAIAASPETGRKLFESLSSSEDPDVIRILRNNLSKNRLIKMDPGWVEDMKSRLSLP